MVDNEFLYEALCHFDLVERYVQLITRLHTFTTAAFLVNGEQSSPISAVHGIRQDRSLGPLLFQVVMELLGVAVQQLPDLSEISVPGRHPATHTLSVLVDKSTIFFDKASQLDLVPSHLLALRSYQGLLRNFQ